MNPGDEIPKLLAPAPIEKPGSGREAWRGFAIIAEFAEATERLNRAGPAVSSFGSARIGEPAQAVLASFEHDEKRGFAPSAREREAQLER